MQKQKMDLYMIQKVVNELRSEISGGIISKIFQPLPRELVFKIYVPGRGEKRLMLSADPKLGRIHLTQLRIPNPPAPPRFCAYLRARLVNFRIVDVSCAADDRVVTIACERRSPDSINKLALILELLGRDSNMIIVDTETKFIMDCLHRIPDKHSHNRIVLPGIDYVPPPTNPLRSRSGFQSDHGETATKSPSSLVLPDGEQSFNDIVDGFYMSLLTDSLTENLRREIARPFKSKVRALSNRILKIEEDIKRLQKFIGQGKYGELLKTKLGKFEKGLSSVNVTEWETGESVTVPLDPALDPVSNMNKFFVRSAKGKRGIGIALERLKATIAEKAALEELLYFIDEAGTQNELEILSRQMALTKDIPRRHQKNDPKKTCDSRSLSQNYLEVIGPCGSRILIGKNSAGNDFILRNKARANDIWFHVKDAPGSHVIMIPKRDDMLPDPDIYHAATMAAKYSKLKKSWKTEVLFTEVKNISRVKGGLLGQVKIGKYRTIVVDLRE